jgi:hypothetical protein
MSGVSGFKRPTAVWIYGIAGTAMGALGIIASLVGLITDGVADAPAAAVTGPLAALVVGLLGLGLFTGKRLALIVARILWALGCAAVVLSSCASLAVGAGPNWSHGIGVLIAALTSPIWGASVGYWCTEKLVRRKGT